MSGWNRKQSLKLIELYEQFPALYNIKSADYKNRCKRQKCLQEICEALKTEKSDVKPADIVAKIRTLRTQYCNEKRLLENSKKSGAGLDEVREPTLWCYELLKFLDVNGENELTIETNIPFFQGSISNQTTTEEDVQGKQNEGKEMEFGERIQKRKTTTEYRAKVLKSFNLANELVREVRSDKANNCREVDLGKIVELQTKGLKDDIFFEAKIKILEVLMDAQKKNIRRTTVLHHSTPTPSPSFSYSPSPPPSSEFTEGNSRTTSPAPSTSGTFFLKRKKTHTPSPVPSNQSILLLSNQEENVVPLPVRPETARAIFNKTTTTTAVPENFCHGKFNVLGVDILKPADTITMGNPDLLQLAWDSATEDV